MKVVIEPDLAYGVQVDSQRHGVYNHFESVHLDRSIHLSRVPQYHWSILNRMQVAAFGLMTGFS